jgi:hypothetical protein
MKPQLTMKTSFTTTLLIVLLSSGCASKQSSQSANTAKPSRCCAQSASQGDIWHVNGDVRINVHVPADLAGHTITYYLNDQPACVGGTNLSFTMSVPPYWKNKIGIKMTGAKPFEQDVKVAGYGSKQVLDVTLAEE